MLKKISLIFIALISLLLVVALFVDNRYEMTRSVVINKPKIEVFNYIRYLKNHPNFTRWAELSPRAPRVYKGIDGEVGAAFSWRMENNWLTRGEKEITAIEEGNRLDFEIRILEPYQLTTPAYIITESQGANKTKITWSTVSELSYPKNIMLLFIDYEDRRGADMQAGLNKLKLILEGKST